jgi:lipopolysaccharide/colanic/teichoic acid biosynthesis glycosyltransferase
MIKRSFDILVSLAVLLVLSPVLLVTGIAVALGSEGGALFEQVRVGRRGKEFHLLKFRTMRPGSEAGGQITVGMRDPRITGVGLFLRRTKLDELPQLINVLRGDMSLVGPRPEVPRYVALYSSEQRKVLEFRPGITGLASLAYFRENELLGRSADPHLTYVEEVMPAKLALELEYLRRASFSYDLHLLALTVAKLLGSGSGNPAIP